MRHLESCVGFYYNTKVEACLAINKRRVSYAAFGADIKVISARVTP